jgi:type I restriction enzyme M protein
MGYVFEELIRKFNEENNEEAGEHFTPREVIDLMTHLVFDPVKDADQLQRAITIYDPACGSGGMLTESQDFVKDPDGHIRAAGDVYLYGKEINDETYAICKSDMMIKGNNPENIRVGSTLSTDEFSGQTFDFMLSNPPYGKSWSSEQKNIKDGKEVIDPRFKVKLQDYWGNEEIVDATPRSSDGQLLFLMEMVSKMKDPRQNGIGSRIASVHNGSSLFTGDAGGGESNIRRYLLENDLLEAIIQLPNNLFYNTGITTYIWLLNNNKAADRRGKVLLLDASELYAKLRKNLGAKNCELTAAHIAEIQEVFTNFADVDMGVSPLPGRGAGGRANAYYKINLVGFICC